MIIITEEKLKEYLESKSFSRRVYDDIVALSENVDEDVIMYGVTHKNDESKDTWDEFVEDMYDTYEEAYDAYIEYLNKNQFAQLTQNIEIVLLENDNE